MTIRRNLLVLPLAAFLASASFAADIDRTPPIVEAAKVLTLQEQITLLSRDVYNQYKGNTPEIQHKIAEGVLEALRPLVESGKIGKLVVVCDDTNNPPEVVDSGFVLLFILWSPPNAEVGTANRVLIGPEQFIQRLAN